MEVTPGYKQTEVGGIPEDWGVVCAFDACSKIQDGTHFSPRIGGSDYLYVTSKNIRFGHLDMSTASCIDAAQHQVIYRRCDVKKGDLLLTKDGANTGNAALNTLDEEFSLLSSVAFLRFDPRKHCAAYYLQQILTSQCQRQIQDAMAGNAITRLTLEKINKLRFPAPPTKTEQEAIAEALNDADAFIGSVEHLLAKKRQLKQGAMQELLAGKKRLPGFSGGWEVKPLGDCFALLSSRNTELNDNVVTISAQQGFVRQEEFFKKRVASPVLGNYYLIERGHFAYNRSYSNGYPFGAIKRLTRYDKGVVTTLYICFALKPEAESDPTFFEHYFEAGLLNSGLSTVTNEGGRAHGLLNITKADFFSCEIKRPPLPEQTAIAAVIADMDAEIGALEAKLAKARQLKQGMMQELLTGRIRLV